MNHSYHPKHLHAHQYIFSTFPRHLTLCHQVYFSLIYSIYFHMHLLFNLITYLYCWLCQICILLALVVSSLDPLNKMCTCYKQMIEILLSTIKVVNFPGSRGIELSVKALTKTSPSAVGIPVISILNAWKNR